MKKLLLALTVALAQAAAWANGVISPGQIDIALGDGSVRILGDGSVRVLGDGSVRLLAGDGSVVPGDGSVRLAIEVLNGVERWTLPELGLSKAGSSVAQLPNFTFAFDSDPWISFGLSVFNLTATDQTFLFEFGAPYIGGTYNTLSSELTANVPEREAGPGSLTSTTHDSTVDGVTRLGTTAGDCSPPALGCFSAAGSTTLSPVTPAAGFFTSRLAFTLGAGDSAVLSGRTDLFNTDNQVPTPGALPLALLALAGLAAWRQTRRARPAQ